MKSQVTSIILNDSSVVGYYNACRHCSSDCWVDPPIPDGVPPPNTCIICREVRAVNRQYWTPSQMKSIWALRTSVTTNHNCCRSCDPSCWVSILGKDAPSSQHDRPDTPMPPTPLSPPLHVRRAQPPPTAFTSGVNLHRHPPHRLLLLRHRRAVTPSLTGAHFHVLRVRLSTIALVGWTRSRSRTTYCTFGKPSLQAFGTLLSAIWRSPC